MLDDRVLTVLARLEDEDRAEREAGVPASASRQADPTLSSVTVPLDRGLELTTVLRES